MSCCCENTECIDVYINDCVNEVNTQLKANIGGMWSVLIEFNGTWRKVISFFAAGASIKIPNVFNASYKHVVKLIDPNGNLFNNTCYVFNMNNVLDTILVNVPVTNDLTFIIKDNPDPTAGTGTPDDPYQLKSGMSVYIAKLNGKKVHFPIYLNDGVRQSITYNSDSSTFDNTPNGGFIDGDLITISYEEVI